MLHPVHGVALVAYLAGSFLFTAVLIALLQFIPQQFRRHVILAATFLGGLFYALEFFLPTHLMPTPNDPKHQGNFLTIYLVPFGVLTQVIAGWTVGLGVLNLLSVHGKRVFKKAEGRINSLAFLASMILMTVFGILQQSWPKPVVRSVYDVLFYGGLQSLDATMFSIIAFYIVSAAYRAFRVRTAEATMLLVTAFLVMLGQIAIGQWLTHWHFVPNYLHVEVIRNWILTVANAAATRAIAFGLGIGSLAVALRIWLGLERGSYFERQG